MGDAVHWWTLWLDQAPIFHHTPAAHPLYSPDYPNNALCYAATGGVASRHPGLLSTCGQAAPLRVPRLCIRTSTTANSSSPLAAVSSFSHTK